MRVPFWKSAPPPAKLSESATSEPRAVVEESTTSAGRSSPSTTRVLAAMSAAINDESAKIRERLAAQPAPMALSTSRPGG